MGDARQDLIATVNSEVYPEYTPGGWLKACSLNELRVLGHEAQELFAAYQQGNADGVELRLWLIRLFLADKLAWLIPESSCAMNIALTPLQRVTRAQAEDVANAIIRLGVAEQTGVDYARLRLWFFDQLLQPESVMWFANSSPEHVAPGSLAAVVGLDCESVALFWLD